MKEIGTFDDPQGIDGNSIAYKSLLGNLKKIQISKKAWKYLYLKSICTALEGIFFLIFSAFKKIIAMSNEEWVVTLFYVKR